MSEVKRYTAWAAEVALPRGTMVVLAADYDALAAELATERLRADAAVGDANEAEQRVAELEGLLNTPHTAEWFEGVKFEAGHQITRWGADHDAGKAPADWFWLIGYLAQKAMIAQIAGDKEKACHHTISTGAAMLNWFRAIVGDSNAMRPSIDAALTGQQQQGEPHNCDLEGGHLPIGWGGLVFCELCSARLPDEPALAEAEQPVIYPEDGPDERAALSTALFNALESYEASRGKFSRKDQKIHAKQCELIRQHAAQLLAGQPAAVDERRDWSCYDTTFLLEHIRRDTNFDADLIGAMLKFSQTAQPFCHRMTVVMPERTVARFPNSWASGWNACLDKLTCLNRNTVPLELLERVADTLDDICNGSALERELRAILGAKP